MRYAVIGDIHANLPALDAVLADVAGAEVHDTLVLGDLVGYGPFPNECIERVAAGGWLTVAGNHDLIALGRLSDERCIASARTTLAWTRSILSDESIRFLTGLPLNVAVAGDVVMTHGTLGDPQEYLTTPAQARANLERMDRDFTGGRVLLVGHTHRPWACDGAGTLVAPTGTVALTGRMVLNPGAVGQVRGGGPIVARYLILDTDAGRAEFRSVRYDVARTRAQLRRHDLPPRTYRLRRTLGGAVRRISRHLRG